MPGTARNRSRSARDRATQTVTQCDGPTREWGKDEPKLRLQLIDCKSLTSDGFDSVRANEPDSGTDGRFPHQEEQPFAPCLTRRWPGRGQDPVAASHGQGEERREVCLAFGDTWVIQCS